MDAAKRAALEKRIVVGLVGLFLVTFAMGPMKSLGWFRPRPQPAPAQRVAMSKPLGVVMEDFWKRADPELSGKADRAAAEPVPPAYTAHDLRDPFKSLLPQPSSVSGLPAAPPITTPPAPPAKRPAPDLRVEGVVWGGPTPSAIIDGKVYRVGDTIQHGTIISIDRRGITLEHEGGLILYPPIRQQNVQQRR